MRGASKIIEVVLIFVITVTAVAVAVPWAIDSFEKSRDAGEIQTVKGQLELCNDKLVETARTGSSNKCIFSIEKGRISAYSDGIYYKILTKADVCDQHNWVLINPDKHLWQKCDVLDIVREYQLKWSWPKDITIRGQNLDGDIYRSDSDVGDIIFDDNVTFITLTLIVEFNYTEGQEGKTIEMTRVGFEEDKAILKVNII